MVDRKRTASMIVCTASHLIKSACQYFKVIMTVPVTIALARTPNIIHCVTPHFFIESESIVKPTVAPLSAYVN